MVKLNILKINLQHQAVTKNVRQIIGLPIYDGYFLRQLFLV